MFSALPLRLDANLAVPQEPSHAAAAGSGHEPFQGGEPLVNQAKGRIPRVLPERETDVVVGGVDDPNWHEIHRSFGCGSLHTESCRAIDESAGP